MLKRCFSFERELIWCLFFRESTPNWEQEIKDDVIEECNRHGGCVHVFVDKASPQGNVYVKCPTITTAVAAVNSLHGRWFGGEFSPSHSIPQLLYFLAVIRGEKTSARDRFN